MLERLRIFISVGPELELEREYIGQALARFPVSLGWDVQYTPNPREDRALYAEMILSCHFHILLLGVDITAPVGWELWIAKKAGKVPLGFAKNIARSPAAMVFYRESGLAWVAYDEPPELMALIQQHLAQRLLEQPTTYGLTLAEWETLSAFRGERAQGSQRGDIAQAEDRTRSGAGKGGVILAPGKLPPGGVLVGQKENAETDPEGEA